MAKSLVKAGGKAAWSSFGKEAAKTGAMLAVSTGISYGMQKFMQSNSSGFGMDLTGASSGANPDEAEFRKQDIINQDAVWWNRANLDLTSVPEANSLITDPNAAIAGDKSTLRSRIVDLSTDRDLLTVGMILVAVITVVVFAAG